MLGIQSIKSLWSLMLDFLGYATVEQQPTWDKLNRWLSLGAPKIAADIRKKHQLSPEQSLTLEMLVEGYLDWLQVDDRVVDALEFANGPGESGFAQLYQDALLAADNAGALARLQGYVGEQVAAAQLSEQGFVVSFPEMPNQPAYDLLVDGHPVQVKTTLMTSGIQRALDRHPDIPVLAPIELSQGPLAGSEQVIFSPDFSYQQVQHLTEDSLVALRDIGHLAVPFLSLAFVGYKVGRQVQAGKGLQIAAVDGVGEVVGMLAGAKTGMVLGGAIGGLVAGAVGSALVSWTAAAGVASIVASVGGKIGLLMGGASLLMVGPLGPILALGALGALLGSILGRSLAGRLIFAWRYRDLMQWLEPLCSAAQAYQRELEQGFCNKTNAYQQKIRRVRKTLASTRVWGMRRFRKLLLIEMQQKKAELHQASLNFPTIKTADELRGLTTQQGVQYAQELVQQLAQWKPEMALYPSASFKAAAEALGQAANQLLSYLKLRS